MGAFSQDVVEEVSRRAEARGIEPALALAVVEVESAGNPFERDGVTPVFRFEKHVFYRQLYREAPTLLERAKREGLAQPGQDLSSQGGPAARLAMLENARAIDAELANRSASWGLGQIMGFHAVRIGYGSASDMVDRMASGGAVEQLDAMLRFIVAEPALLLALRSRNWARFARIYNGKSYAKTRYDTKLETAYGAWSARLRRPGSAAPVPVAAVARSRQEMTRLQEQLAQLGYPVGQIDGLFGPITSSALFAFQMQNGLPATGQPDDRTLLALPGGLAMPVAEDRARANVQDLLRDGVPAIVAAQANRRLALGVGAAGGLGVLGAVPGVGEAVGRVFGSLLNLPQTPGQPAGIVDTLVTAAVPFLGLGGAVPAAAIGAGLFLLRSIAGIADARVADHREGFERNSPSRAVLAPVERWRS
jgi:peptidoglycan hydrolase-like protein with peptidoglycan-binding domain